jgi:hypothetical protein
LRNELTKLKGFEFAIAIVKAKVEPTNIEREVVYALEETWVRASSFPRKAKKEMVIKEISHRVGDPVEVDGESLRSEGAIRVKVLCKDALNVKGNTLIFINKQGYLIHWKSEKLGIETGDDSIDDNSPKLDDSDGEGDNDELDDGHDSGFAKLAREQREEKKKKEHLKKAGGMSQTTEMEWEAMAHEEFSLSQTKQKVDIPKSSSRQQTEVDVRVVSDKLAREEEMNMIDAIFEIKTKKPAHVIQIQHEAEGEGELLGKEMADIDEQKERKKVAIGKRTFVLADKTSARITDKTTKILEKAQNKMEYTSEDKNYFSILNTFTSQHFVNVASACGVSLGDSEEKELDVISTVLAKERA